MLTKELTLIAMKQRWLEQTLALCDKCVGEHLYTRADFAQVIERDDQEVFLLLTPAEKVVGYIYCRLIDVREAEQLSKQSLQQLDNKVFKACSLLGILQSIGISEAYRQQGLSNILVEAYLQWLWRKTAADIAFGVFWKPHGKAPMGSILENFGFYHLTDAQNVWYDNENLICPVCHGRCRCEAAIYYKILERREAE